MAEEASRTDNKMKYDDQTSVVTQPSSSGPRSHTGLSVPVMNSQSPPPDSTNAPPPPPSYNNLPPPDDEIQLLKQESTGFSAPIINSLSPPPDSTKAPHPPSYNNVPPPADEIQLHEDGIPIEDPNENKSLSSTITGRQKENGIALLTSMARNVAQADASVKAGTSIEFPSIGLHKRTDFFDAQVLFTGSTIAGEIGVFGYKPAMRQILPFLCDKYSVVSPRATTGTTIIGMVTNEALYMAHDGGVDLNGNPASFPWKWQAIRGAPNGIYCLHHGNLQDVLRMSDIAALYTEHYQQRHGTVLTVQDIAYYYRILLRNLQHVRPDNEYVCEIIIGGGMIENGKQSLYVVRRSLDEKVTKKKVKLFTCGGSGRDYARDELHDKLDETAGTEACVFHLREAMKAAAAGDPHTAGFMNVYRITPQGHDMIHEVNIADI